MVCVRFPVVRSWLFLRLPPRAGVLAACRFYIVFFVVHRRQHGFFCGILGRFRSRGPELYRGHLPAGGA